MAAIDRSHHDKPAILVASALGVLTILGSVFFLPAFYCESPAASCAGGAGGAGRTFDVAWGQKAVDSKDVQASARSGGSASVTATGLVRGVDVTFVSCTDSANPALGQQPARITLRISDGTTTVAKETTCAESAPFSLTRPAPDIAVASGGDESSARAFLWTSPALHNGTGTYKVEVQVTRAAGAAPIGLPSDPTLTATVRVAASNWDPVLTLRAQEVAK